MSSTSLACYSWAAAVPAMCNKYHSQLDPPALSKLIHFCLPYYAPYSDSACKSTVIAQCTDINHDWLTHGLTLLGSVELRRYECLGYV